MVFYFKQLGEPAESSVLVKSFSTLRFFFGALACGVNASAKAIFGKRERKERYGVVPACKVCGKFAA